MSDATSTHEDHGLGHITPPSLLLGVFAALILLTGLTVAVTFVNLGAGNIWIALAVAVAKGALVALYFMHLRYDSPFNGLILVCAFLFLAIFIGISLMDTGEYQKNIEPPATVQASTG